jgi:hypothetical protein
MVFETPSLALRLVAFAERDEELLAEALPTRDRLLAALAAAQIIAVRRVLARDNWRRIDEGRPASRVHPMAVKAATKAFTHLREGFGEFA